MELKPYQQTVINDLAEFISQLEVTNQINIAFEKFWESKGVSVRSIDDNFLKPYDNAIKGVPRVTVKVPTAGGKTFIACNALKTIFDSFPTEKSKVVVWFVPSDTILKQTVKNLSDVSHPYRQKLDSHFGNTVKVYEKEALLFGAGFSPTEVKEQLSILVLSVQSFSANNKDSRKAYQENENLQQFPATYQHTHKLLPDVDETALMQVINQLHPVIIIDESHNFEADLRIEMLNNINPSFILDLTATPKERSNIISFVDAIHLKNNNMVKLPVIVLNHQDTNEVISRAINMQKTLQSKAEIEEKNGGKYIRPIVLFQAQSKTNDDNVTYEKIKSLLIESGIPSEQIRIKTATKDEIKKEDLMSRDCPVKYIITVDALKEGWDCPFAYILASLANKSSVVDVEQILGRILRQPYVTKHKEDLLNYSYVFTSSDNFHNTLNKIIEGLNKCGFSAKDYRTKDSFNEAQANTENLQNFNLGSLFNQPTKVEEPTNKGNINITDVESINTESIKEIINSDKAQEQINEVISIANQTNEQFEIKRKELSEEETIIPTALENKVPTYPIKEIFKEEVKDIVLPAFYKKVNNASLFNPDCSEVPLSKKLLLTGFELSKEDIKIDFTQSSSEMASVDLVEGRKDEYVPEYRKVTDEVKEQFVKYIASLPNEKRIAQLSGMLVKRMKNIDEISQPELQKYVENVLSSLDSDKLAEITHNEYFYTNKIKSHIQKLADAYSEKQFGIMLDKGTVVCKEHFKFLKKISPLNTLKGITKNLYIEEGEMNDFERKVIFEIANLDSVVFWHRNLERGKGFYLNGFINHYPDFIVKTKNNKIVLIETKGDDRDNSDSLKKIRLGEKWAAKAGDRYRYFMVFNNAKLEGAKSVNEVIDIIKDMK